ncbi:MAG: hypothetical protein JWO52_6028 [Gammaproteobacteria bacterium]|jgi:hypothetical protein|nr:hypothetical protein [Gammaproteobacteria bacterium]
MNAQDAIVLFTALLMLGLIWVRTRVQYSRAGAGPLRLQRAGQIYFGAVLALLAVGWFAAPVLGRTFWPVPGVTPTLMRVVWCLATYYIFIVVHRVMKTRGAAVFQPQPGPLV